MGTIYKKNISDKTRESLILLEPKMGIEPTTYALRVRCSTSELLRLDNMLYYTILSVEVQRASEMLLFPDYPDNIQVLVLG